VDGNKWHAFGHYTNISVQTVYEKRNTLNIHLRNYESISGIPINKKEIRTTESTTSVDVCLTVVSFLPTEYKTK